ncbi:MAG: patatin-like phospholipase family protein [Bacteroidales bacterium]
MESKPYRIGLALSGGGAKGFAHIGAIKALEEYGLIPDIVSGVSAGSLVGALYCDGHTPEQMIEMFRPIKFLDFAEIVVPKKSFLTMNGFKSFLKNNISANTFEGLKKPLMIVATDLDHGNSIIFKTGDKLIDKIAASCSIPVLFAPQNIDGVNYVDGGVLKNFPVTPLIPLCDIVIGVNATPLVLKEYKKTIISIAERSYTFMFKANSFQDMQLSDLTIETKETYSYSLFDTQHVNEIVDIGYNATIQALEQSKAKTHIMQYAKQKFIHD